MAFPTGAMKVSDSTRTRLEIVVAEVAGDEPAAGDDRADDDTRKEVVEASAECGLRERERDEAAAEQHRQHDAHRARIVRPEHRREQRREPLVVEPVLVEGDVGRFEDGDAQQPSRPRSVVYAVMPSTSSTTRALRFPPPKRTRLRCPQPAARVIPTPKAMPPTT